MDIFNKFETKLKQNIESIKTQNKQIKESEVRFRGEVEERQRVHQLYETQLQNCRQLMDSLSKLETDSKIFIEKESIEFKEEKTLYLNQMQRMSEQLNQLKHEMIGNQSKCFHLEQTLLRRQTELENQNSFRLVIDSEMSQIQTKSQTLIEEITALSQNQSKLKDIVNSCNVLNEELKAKLIQRNQQLIDVNKDNEDLKAFICELKEKCRQSEEAMNDSELQSLRLTQTNDLQTQEIKELRELLEQLIPEKQLLTKQLNKSDINANESIGCDMNDNEVFVQTQDSTAQ